MMKNQILSFYGGRITIDPSICNGKPTIRGKRITVHTILEFLGAGDAEADILEQYPSLEPEDIRACQRFAAELMNRRYLKLEWCLAALNHPIRRETQPDGRIRHWVFVPELGKYLRVVTLSDGITLHNAFPDRRFKP